MSAPPGPTSSARTRPRRNNKVRTGCEQCKRRKVKCDEKQPTCSRCVARGETCTGNFRLDTWQIERPWIIDSQSIALGSALENDALRYWYDKACLVMAMFPPPINPLSYPLATLLRRSKALRHAVQCVSDAHRGDFTHLVDALQERSLAIVSLQGEVSRIQATKNREMLLRTLILTSLILCVSSGWMDPSGKEFGMEFLLGINGVISLLSDENPTDVFAFYILGFYLYCESFSSYLIPVSMHKKTSHSALAAISQPPFNTLVHPVTGISTTLCPIITEIGQYYRYTVETGKHLPEHFQDLTRRLLDWKPPENCPRLPQLIQLAEGYRSIGDIMLYQARRVVEPLDPANSSLLLEKVLAVMQTIMHIPKKDTLINWVGPLLVIAGSELPVYCQEERRLVERTCLHLVTFTRIPTYKRGLELVKEVWRLRDEGSRVSWLELMLERGLSLALG